MASLVLIDPACTFNAVDLKAFLRGLNVSLGIKAANDTAGGNTSDINKPSLKNTKITLTFKQDFAAASVNSTVYAVWKNRSTFVVSVRPTAGSAASVTNPDISGTFFVSGYDPLSAEIGGEVYCKVELTQALDDFAMTGL
jgi:hypothetical protein